VARIGSDPDFLDELVQTLRAGLLVGAPPAPPRIASYSGRGPLAGWLRITAVRTAIDLRRTHRELQLDDDLGARLGVEGDAELSLLRARYLADFQRALEDAIDGLSPRDRMLLRLYVMNGMTIDELGAIYHVHRATISRQLSAARAAIFDETRRLLAERLRLAPSEINGLLRAVRSQLNLSLGRILASR
jgi:RNA polymerase sigma-70 factor (ECF subfamily)